MPVVEGAYQKIRGTRDCLIVTATYKSKRDLETDIREAAFSGKVIVLNCAYLNSTPQKRAILKDAGLSSLQYGAYRLLLVTPKQAELLREFKELHHSWRKVADFFDRSRAGYIVGDPNRRQREIEDLIAKGADWNYHLYSADYERNL